MSFSIPNLKTYVDANHRSVAGLSENLGVTVGKHLSDAEKNLIAAYSLKHSDNTDQLASKLGVSKADATVESLQLIAKSRYEKSTQSFNLLIQLLSNVHQNIMSIIQSIRAR